MRALASTLLATLGLIAGLLLLPTPVPLGLPLIVGSLAVLLAADPRAQRGLRGLRGRSRRLDVGLFLLESRIRGHAAFLAAPLRATRLPHRFRVRQRRLGAPGTS